MTEGNKDTLYYDGQCPLCLREITQLKSMGDDTLALIDIHSLSDEEPSSAHCRLPDKDALLRTLHLETADAKLLTGLDANVAGWKHTPYGRWLAWLRWPLIAPCADFVYGAWARWRYRRLYGKGPAEQNQRGTDRATG